MSIAKVDLAKSSSSAVWCDQCKEQGVYFTDQLEASVYLKCVTCGADTSDVWCPKCGMGGPFLQPIDKKPDSWRCPDCRTEYYLPVDFYKHPVNLYPERRLPKELSKRLNDQKLKTSLARFTYIFIAILLAAVIVWDLIKKS